MREEGRGKGEGVAGDNRRPLAPSLSGSSAARPLAVVTYVPVAAFRLRPALDPPSLFPLPPSLFPQ